MPALARWAAIGLPWFPHPTRQPDGSSRDGEGRGEWISRGALQGRSRRCGHVLVAPALTLRF